MQLKKKKKKKKFSCHVINAIIWRNSSGNAMLFSPLCYSLPAMFFLTAMLFSPPRYAFSLPAMLFPSCYTCCRCYCQFITTFLCYQRLKCGYFVMSYTEILQYIQNLYYKLTE